MKYFLVLILVFQEYISFSQREEMLILDTSLMDLEFNSIGRDNLDFKTFTIRSESQEIVNPEEKLILICDTISSTEFEKMRSVFKSKMIRDTSLVRWTDTSFIISTGNTEISFRANRKDDSIFEYYLGYLSPLQLFAVSSIDSRQEIGYLKLVDKVSGTYFYMESPSDYPMDSLEISSKNKFLSAYVNDLYNDRVFVSLFKISQNEGKYSFMDAGGIYFLQSRMLDLVWLNENEFSVYLYELDPEGLLIQELYLKVKIV